MLKLPAIFLAASIGFAPIAQSPATPAAPAVDAPAPADAPAPTKKHKKHKKVADAAARTPAAAPTK